METNQLQLFSSNGNSKQIIYLHPDDLYMSEFNPRKNRSQQDIQHLAERIARNGFELTRAPWAYFADGKYLVFAGGTRLAAAREAKVISLPVILHDGYTEEEIIRLADEDNENDEYHLPVPIVDIWDSYKALKDMGWTQERIAQAKGVSRVFVTFRLQLAELPDSVKGVVNSQKLNERQCLEFIKLLTVNNFDAWLSSETAILEIIESVFKKTLGPTAKTFEAEVSRYNGLYRLAEELYKKLDGDWCAKFVDALAGSKARSESKIQTIYSQIVDQKTEHAKREEFAIMAAQSEAEAERQRLEREQEIQRVYQIALEKIVCGNALTVSIPDGIRLMFTDPPYGVDFQSNRRIVAQKADKIANDETPGDAIELLKKVLSRMYSKMLTDSFLLVWTSHRYEPQFRDAICACGFEYRQTLIWVKNNHGSGDLDGSFAPKHECIIVAVKGNPKLTGERLDDVLTGSQFVDSNHPTKKPIDLIMSVIETTTDSGDIVADPFAGSGSTILAAIKTGRDYWGCELDRGYHSEISDRILRIAKDGIDAKIN